MKGARPDVTCTADKITPLEKARLKKNQKLVDILARLERATEASSSLAETVARAHPRLSPCTRLTHRVGQAHKFTPPAPKDIKAVVEANGQAGVVRVCEAMLPAMSVLSERARERRACGSLRFDSIRCAGLCVALQRSPKYTT